LAAVLSVVLGSLSILSVFSWLFHFIPLTALGMSLWARYRISRRPEILTGSGIATAGIIITLVTWSVGTVGLLYLLSKEVPHGYTRLTFEMLLPGDLKSGKFVPPDIEKLEGEKVFLKGYIYPGRQTINLKNFLLVPTIGHCKFCTSQIAPHEIVQVELVGDLKTEYTSYPTRVGGRLRIDKDVAEGKAHGLPYRIEADYIR